MAAQALKRLFAFLGLAPSGRKVAAAGQDGLRTIAPVAAAVKAMRTPKPRPVWIMTVLASAAAVIAAYYFGNALDSARVRGWLETRVEWNTRDLQSRIEQLAEPVTATAAFVGVSGANLTPVAFERFASYINELHPLIRTLVWAPHVQAADRPEFERRSRQSGGGDFRIRERTPDGIVEASSRDAYVAILFGHSFVPTVTIPIGIDLLAQPVNRAAILHMRDTGIAAASPPSLSRVSVPPELIINLFAPVYFGLRQPTAIAERRAAWGGTTVASFGVPALLEQAVATMPRLPSYLHVEIAPHAWQDAASASIFLTTSGLLSNRFEQVAAIPAPTTDTAFRLVSRFDALGHTWALTFDYPASVLPDTETRRAAIWPVFALVLSVLVHLVLARELRRTARAEHGIISRTEELKAVLDSIPAFVWIATDAECRRVIGNRAADELLRVAQGTNVSKTGTEPSKAPAVRLLKEDGSEYRIEEMPLRRAVQQNRPVHDAIIDFRFADGRRIEVIGNATPFDDAAGSVRGGVAAFIDVTGRRKTEARLRESLARVRTLSERIVKVQETERQALAQELHDEVGQTLTAIKIHLQAAEQTGGAAPELTAHLDEALLAATRALQQGRGMSLDLRPLQLDELGLAAALRRHAERQAALGGWALHFDENIGRQRFAPDLEITCFRVAQEAHTNILRHAAADEVWVALRRRGAELRLTVRDNGRGFSTESALADDKRSFGLTGMSERVATAGGSFEIASSSGAGTTVDAAFPIGNAAPNQTWESEGERRG